MSQKEKWSWPQSAQERIDVLSRPMTDDVCSHETCGVPGSACYKAVAFR